MSTILWVSTQSHALIKQSHGNTSPSPQDPDLALQRQGSWFSDPNPSWSLTTYNHPLTWFSFAYSLRSSSDRGLHTPLPPQNLPWQVSALSLLPSMQDPTCPSLPQTLP